MGSAENRADHRSCATNTLCESLVKGGREEVALPLPMAMDAASLKRRRKRLGLTQAELAKRMGVTWNTVARWETGQRKVPGMAEVLLGYIEREVRGDARRKMKRGKRE